MAKQLNKLQSNKQATASTEQTASKAGKSALYAAIGLALLILGVILAASGSLGIGIVLYVVGGILFTVFGIIALVYLISGR
ncbi:MAG: hypothetical protein EOO63_16445 [Hymenobacter sp.]|nr:MAG: hypothetical protein EOO63_16445 [Hymenobacter sp.]